MLTVISCLLDDHDYRLVALAAVVCAVGSWIVVQVLLRTTSGRKDLSLWPYLAGVAFGASIWATHFIAMLAYLPGAGAGYEPGVTTFSLLIAVTASIAGFVAPTLSASLAAALAGGAVVGLGVGAMHYLGMRAISSAAFIDWDPTLVASSLALGVVFGAAAMAALRQKRAGLTLAALVLAICGVHFTGMSAATFRLVDGAAPDALLNNGVLAAAVALVTAMIIATGLLATLIDKRATHDSGRRLQNLADAAIEGLLLVENGRIVRCNRSLAELAGYSEEDLHGHVYADLVREVAPHEQTELRAKHVLLAADGRRIPIELLINAWEGQNIYAVRDLREKLNSEARIHYLAHHDALTGLPNRVTFLDHFDALLARNVAPVSEIAVLGLDLDRFKEVNDVYGHAMGDAALIEISARMRAALKDGEFLARVGGDEFVAVQTGGRQPESANDLCERLMTAATQSILIENHLVQLGLSIGVSVYPKDGATSSELLANADLAMYRAKETSGAVACFFSSEMDDSVRLRRALARDLRNAVDNDELELHYQVQTSIATHQTVGYEVLLRWNHPQRGLIGPSEFIPIAEETGLILPIGEWVIRRACADAAGWSVPHRVAVNVSGVQFSQGDLPGLVHAALVESGLAPVRLELEITESVLISDMPRTLSILRRLKTLGVSVAMDDFGTGYSSLSTLRAFPFDKIKIDRSFVDQVETHPQARSIVRAILALGRSLDIPVLAEGVETPEHLAFLREEGCDEAQGYLLGRPVPMEAALVQRERLNTAV